MRVTIAATCLALAASLAAAPASAADHPDRHPTHPDGDSCLHKRVGKGTDWLGALVKVRITMRVRKCWTDDSANRGFVAGRSTRPAIAAYPPRVCSGHARPAASDAIVHHFIIQNVVVVGHRKGRAPDAEILNTAMSPMCRKVWPETGYFHKGYWWWGHTFQWGRDLGMNLRQRRVHWHGGRGVHFWTYVRPVCIETFQAYQACGPDYMLSVRRLSGQL